MDHILGEVEIQVKGDAGQAGDAADAERAPDESLSPLWVEDIPGPLVDAR
ncbi:UNVERIFIED_CONTAM: hypothetical protein Sangu_2880700 [Sesamum angustifolium]|uniref:Uncharacterized protein n=1 Tax=Sesamum angustifolium TaxID=2727405 RepID=A0AAW2IP04_9LAMI